MIFKNLDKILNFLAYNSIPRLWENVGHCRKIGFSKNTKLLVCVKDLHSLFSKVLKETVVNVTKERNFDLSLPA